MHIHCLLRKRTALCLGFIVAMLASSSLAHAQRVTRPGKRGRYYKVRIDSAPQQAAIYLDDEALGIVAYTPWDGRLQKGTWKVIIKKEGWETQTKTITVTRTRRVQETFVPLVKQILPGILQVKADADPGVVGAQVWIDGQQQGVVPAEIQVKDGRHLVEIKKPGFDSFAQWVELKQGQTLAILPTMKQNAVGSIIVEADVPEAEVYVDGNAQPGTTPHLVSGLPAGPHIVEVRKAPAIPWKQTVMVKANETVKVRAQLQATIGGVAGSIRVISSTKGAIVLLDGKHVGAAPVDLKGVAVGKHVVEVEAPGHQNKVDEVVVGAGQALVLKMDLLPSGGGEAILKIASAVPEADVFVDGARLGTVPQEKKVPVGEHFVIVSKKGYASFEKKYTVKAGQEIKIMAELKAVGGLRFVSTPPGANVSIDGEVVCQTPCVKDDVAVGEHVIMFSSSDYYDKEQTVKVEGGKLGVVNATLDLIETGPSEEELIAEQRSQSSFGARTLRRENVNVDLGVGYPYYLNAGFHIGAGRYGGIGLDASLLVRSLFQRTELGLRGRVNLVDVRPFSLGAFAEVGGGSTFYDDSQRNTFYFKGGGMASLTGLGRVTITARVFVDMWSDRYCPEPANGGFEGTDPSDLCVDYLNRVNGMTGALDDETFSRVNFLLDDPNGADGKLFDRDNGLRLMTSLIVEFAIRQRVNGWIIFEGAPFQDERPAFTDAFNDILFDEDPATYIRAGTTFKF